MGIGTIFYLSGNLFALVAKNIFPPYPQAASFAEKEKKQLMSGVSQKNSDSSKSVKFFPCFVP